MNQTLVTIETSRIDLNMVKVDVKVKDAPVDLFGAAFDLVVRGPDWKLMKYEAGDVFKSAGFEPLMLAVTKTGKDNRVVAGLSMRIGEKINTANGDLINSVNGGLISFYLKIEGGGTLDLSFENNILSALRNEKRVDLNEAQWEKTTVDLADVKLSEVASSLNGSSLAEANVLKPFGGERSFSLWESSLYQVYFVLGVTLAIMVLVVLVLVLGRRLRFGARGNRN